MNKEELIEYEFSLFSADKQKKIKKLFEYEGSSNQRFLEEFSKSYTLLELRKVCAENKISYNQRIDFLDSVKLKVSKRANFLCSKCSDLTQYPLESDDKEVANLSIVSHIYPAINNGPRWNEWINSGKSPDYLRTIENAIFLCIKCSVIIDANEGKEHKVKDLIEMKEIHEKKVREGKVNYKSPLEFRKDYYAELIDGSEIDAITELELLIRDKFTIVSDLSSQTVPSILIRDRNVIGISIPDQKLQSIPQYILSFRYLKILSIKNNHIRDFTILTRILSLEQIHLNYNLIEKIPDGISNLNQLVVLDLKANRISEINPNLFSLISLKKLNLGENQIKSIPEQINSLKNLQTLILIDNKVMSLPSFDFPSLLELDLRNNHFRTDYHEEKIKNQYDFTKTGRTFQEEYPILPQIPSNYQKFLQEVELNITKIDANGLLEIYSFNDLAQFLKIKKSKLFELLLNKSSSFYNEVKISKRHRSSPRIIEQVIYKDLEKAQYIILKYILKKIKPSDQAYGYVKGRSHVKNAIMHLNSEIVINLDFIEFFHSIRFSDVFMFFNALGYSGRISACLTALLLFFNQDEVNSYLPQGTMSSPYLSNLICSQMDEELFQIGRKFKFTYTRYSDDITFSTKEKVLPKRFFHTILKEINKYGFKINKKKLKIQRRYNRQIVTGIVVNHESPGLPRKYHNKLRRELFELKNKIHEESDLVTQYIKLRGKCENVYHINPKRYGKYKNQLEQIRIERNIRWKNN